MSDTSKAIFLSYAREDAAAARRIAEALRAQGIEVWFDENELRGGDAWDAKIRRQIDACSLFVPIISQHTQERSKGYFRLEWKLAVDQTHLLAAGIPFVAPVVIDATKEGEAIVPPEFMKVQWTRLPDALPTPQFVGQIKTLLASPTGTDVGRGRLTPPSNAQAGSGDPALQGKRSKSWLMPVIVGAVVAAGLAFFMLRNPAPTSAEATVGKPPVAAEAKPAAMSTDVSSGTLAKGDKSIAVIPFTNMSEDKEANAFFSDGIHEDILTNLALIRELRVVSRTSVLSYRNTTKSMKQIAQELGVTYILEGSVRRVGNKVRVTGQLIHAATDEHVWAQAYDRDLTDIFAIQAELSSQIAGALKAALSPEEKILIARRPTDNADAYDLYLRARDVYNRQGITQAATDERVALLRKAVELDPKFALAWAELADAYAFAGFTFSPGMDDLLAKAKVAMNRAVQLAPDDSDVLRSLGTYYYYGFRDYARAAEQYERLIHRQPNDPTLFFALGLIQRRQGNWSKSLVSLRRASELDPGNIRYMRNLVVDLIAARRYAEWEVAQRRLTNLLPDSVEEGARLAGISFLARGSKKEEDDYFAQLPPDRANSAEGIYARVNWLRTKGDWAEAARLDKLQPFYDGAGELREEQTVSAALDFYFLGDRAEAKARLADYPAAMRQRLAAEPKNTRLLAALAAVEVVLGNKDSARRYADQAAEVTPIARDAIDGVTYEIIRAQTYDLLGEKQEALAAYRRLISTPSGVAALGNVHAWRATTYSLRGDPEFEALLNDPKNNAPLF